MTKTRPGHMYGRSTDDRLVEVNPTAHVPDNVVCRRAADYPLQLPPRGAALSDCTRCGEIIAFNPAGPYQDRPK